MTLRLELLTVPVPAVEGLPGWFGNLGSLPSKASNQSALKINSEL